MPDFLEKCDLLDGVRERASRLKRSRPPDVAEGSQALGGLRIDRAGGLVASRQRGQRFAKPGRRPPSVSIERCAGSAIGLGL